MSTVDFDVDFFGNFDENSSQSRDQDQEKDKSKSYETVQLVDQISAMYKNGNSEMDNQEQEEKISVARENVEDFIKKSEFQSETQAEKEKQEIRNKIVKIGGILTLCFLLLNFVLVAMVMSRMSEFSSSLSSVAEAFSAVLNQTSETGKIVDQLKFELGGIEKRVNSTEEKFESHHFRIEALSNQTKTEEQFEALENKNQQLEKTLEELKEQFESLSQKFHQLEVNVSLEFKRAPVETPPSITSCSSAMEISICSKNQTIYPHGNGTSLKVLCDFETDGGGWTIIQKRSSGPKEEFNRNWANYTQGFGSLDGNFWLGLENIHALTQNGDQELRIELEDFKGEKKWAKYSSFSISNASDFYRLSIGGFYKNSTAGDSMTNRGGDSEDILNGMRFTTADNDNDNYPHGSCTSLHGGGGWWFNWCSDSNLNGLYHKKGEGFTIFNGIIWLSWEGNILNPPAKTEMKIRTKK